MKAGYRVMRGASHRIAAAVVLGCGLVTAQAGLFDDDEARKAILDLRQRVETIRNNGDESNKRLTDEVQRLNDDNSQLRRSLLDLQNQIDGLKQEQAKTRGQNEQMARDLEDLQRRMKDLAGGVEERLRKFDPVAVTVDGQSFNADPSEKRDFENALAVFRKGDFETAQSAWLDFLHRYPQSGYGPSALFWLGNTQYANRDYKQAIDNFRQLVTKFPDHARAPESLLSIANCQSELKDAKSARRTLEEVLKNYPQSDSAVAAKERLSRVK